jgi:uncharacterized protein (TIGR03083 family)
MGAMSISRALSRDDYVAAVEADGTALAEAGRAGIDVPVPTCPGWVVGDLVGHVGRIYRSVAVHIDTRATEMIPRSEIPDAPAGDAVVAWFEEAHGQVVAALGAVAPDEPIWSWSADATAGFYQRRMAQETLVHRWDAQNAQGALTAVDGDLAADGVSELYELIAPPAVASGSKAAPAGSLHLHRTDGDGEWLLKVDGDRVVLTREHAKGDAAVRASGADLLLTAWGRIDLDDTDADVFGDRSVADAWLALSR